jgi:hypothetical protein
MEDFETLFSPNGQAKLKSTYGNQKVKEKVNNIQSNFLQLNIELLFRTRILIGLPDGNSAQFPI